MKKLLLLSLITLVIGSTTFASTIDTAKKAKAKVKEVKAKATDAVNGAGARLKKDGTPDKRFKATATDATTAAATKTTTAAKEVKVKASDAVDATGARLKKDGTPDKRFKATATDATNAATTTAAKTNAAVTTEKAKVAKTYTQGVNKTEDKAIGTDDKGRTIYLGPRGGKYTLSEKGRKNYIKQN